ncbi:MAG: CRISPR-associated helicase Cas3' [Thermomicrobium sp.]|nr:CRISPR-associated helicase Cas3' [Thermomicrobium sp.]MDW8006820.1 CRISPR-associated helicase Cas3' [Thermomicrobium sp.]
METHEPFAKSGDPPVSLEAHTLDVVRYVEGVVAGYEAVWRSLLGDDHAWIISRALPLAAAVHDLGKAASGFQRSLHERSFRWEFRHEVLSTALLLAAGSVQSPVLRLAAAAVLTHHRDLSDQQLWADCGEAILPRPELVEKAKRRFRERLAEMTPYWEWLHSFWARLPIPSDWDLPRQWQDVEPPREFIRSLAHECEDLHAFRSSVGLLFALARGWLLAADHAASAGIPFFRTAFPVNWEEQHRRRLAQSRTGGTGKLRTFQRVLGEHLGSAFLIAPTGAGKTDAALRWIARNRCGGERVFYVLPYQASIEAMGTTLCSVFGRDTVATLHARTLQIAFQHYFSGEDDYEAAYAAARLESEINRLVHKPIKVTTPFQLLKWLFGIRRFEVGIAELTGALVVFDEIHAYDAHVTALILELVRVIRELGGRCLFMSATFPTFLRSQIESAWGDAIPLFRLDRAPAADAWARALLRTARHELRWTEEPLEALTGVAVNAVQKGQRVLIVANRVQQAQAIYGVLRTLVPSGVHLLHARLTRRDRIEREQQILAGLRGEVPLDLSILVSTQVVEVSLDVSFDMMLTELAPVDDLLQRFGRVNRYNEHRRPMPVVVSRSPSDAVKYVYDLERLQTTAQMAPPSGTALTAVDAEEWVEAVYQGGWTNNEGRRFEQALAAFRTVVDSLRPLSHVETAYEDFYRLFQGAEVLPSCFLEEYTRYMAHGQSLLATQLLVPVPFGTLWKLQNAGRLSRAKDGTLIASIGYDAELGLLPDEADIDVWAI